MLKGIDVSVHQGIIDWAKVKEDGIDYAILRCGYGSDMAYQDDGQFRRNASECERLGIPYGVYLYSYANTMDKANSEADHVLRLIKAHKFDYPVYYDLEDANTTGKCSKDMIADMAEAFCNKIQKAGYKVGIYANLNWFNNYLTDSRFDKWDKWVAQYASKCTYKGKYTMWQYTDKGTVKGIKGGVDMNYCYTNYNGASTVKLDTEMVDGVIKKPETTKKPSTYTKTQFIKDVQKACGAKVDGIAGAETISKTVTVSVNINSTHKVVKSIQKYLNTLGFDCGKVDGIAGVKFTAAVKKYQKANGCVSDGEITASEKTWRKLLGMA